MAWDFSTEPEFQEKLDWIAGSSATEIEPIDLAFGGHLVYDKSHPVHDEGGAPAAGAGEGSRTCGRATSGPTSAARATASSSSALMNEILGRSQLGAEHLRLPGARLRQRRDHRPLRHDGAEGAVPRSRCSTARSSPASR